MDEAAAWVEYCNGPATAIQDDARRERASGTSPWRRCWEIGNEIWGDWVRGHSDAVTYARNLTSYVARMRAVDSSIQVIAVGDNDMTWNRTVLTGTASASTIWRFIITTAAVRWAAICATCWRVRSTTSASTATSKLPGGSCRWIDGPSSRSTSGVSISPSRNNARSSQRCMERG